MSGGVDFNWIKAILNTEAIQMGDEQVQRLTCFHRCDYIHYKKVYYVAIAKQQSCVFYNKAVYKNKPPKKAQSQK